jgi:hypothetical protein
MRKKKVLRGRSLFLICFFNALLAGPACAHLPEAAPPVVYEVNVPLQAPPAHHGFLNLSGALLAGGSAARAVRVFLGRPFSGWSAKPQVARVVSPPPEAPFQPSLFAGTPYVQLMSANPIAYETPGFVTDPRLPQDEMESPDMARFQPGLNFGLAFNF